MSFAPPELPPDGYLLEELGYLIELRAALALNLSPQTLIEYRKSGTGPPFATIGRTVFYSKENLRKWLEAGGTRASVESGTVPDPTAKKPRQTKPAAKAKAVHA